jgi:hypothetical protein
MTAGLSALRNDDLGAGIKRLEGVIATLHLTDEHDPLRLDALRERPRIAEREHEYGRWASTRSSRSGCLASDQVMKPQPTRWLPAAANSRSSQACSP